MPTLVHLLAALLMLTPVSPDAHAAPTLQNDPVAQCAEGVQLFFEGELTQAALHLETGFAQREQTTFANPDDLGVCALALGVIRTNDGHLPEALDAYQVALDIFHAADNHSWEAVTLNNIAAVYDIQGQFTEALKYYRQAVATYREDGDLTGEAATLTSIGALYRRHGRLSEAQTSYQQALAGWREANDPTGESDVLTAIGLVLHLQGQYAQALANFQQALTIQREIGNKAGESVSLNNIGAAYHAQGNYSRALQSYQQALTLSRELGSRSSEANTLDNIGGVYHAQGQYARALENYRQALTIRRELDDRSGEGVSLNNIGGIYDVQGFYTEALAHYQQALEIRREVGDQSGEAVTLNNISAVYEAQGRYDEAFAGYLQALIINRQLGDRAAEGAVLHNLGTLYHNQGRNAEALDYLQQALAISREVGDRDGEGGTLYEIGIVYHAQRRYADALDQLQQSQIIRRQIGDRAGEGAGLNSIGVVYADQGRYAEALESHQQALLMLRTIGNRVGEGNALDHIGWVYHAQGRYAEALDMYQQALAIRHEVGDRSGEGVTLDNIGAVYQAQKQFPEAMESYQQALVIRQEIGDRGGEGVTLNNIGLIYQYLGQPEEAPTYLQHALVIFREVGNKVGEGLTLNNLADSYRAEGKFSEALDLYQQALLIMREVGDPAGEAIILQNIGAVYQAQGLPAEALEHYQRAVVVFEAIRTTAGSEAGRASFIAQYSGIYRTLTDLLYQQGQLEAAFLTTEQSRGRSFLDSLVTGQVQLADSAAADLLAQEQELYAQRQDIQDALAKAQAQQPPEPDLVADLEKQLVEAETAYASIQAAIAAHSTALAALVPGRGADTVLNVEGVQALLGTQTTLLAYYVLPDKILAFILTEDSFEVVALDIDPADVTQKINAFRDFADVTAPNPANAISLYEMLIAPLKHKLTTPHLAIIPHQDLHYLPFAALTDGEHYLIDDYTLTVLPSASTLPFILENAQVTAYSGQPSALILGNPITADYNTVASLVTTRDSLRPLPFAAREARAIAALFGSEPLIGASATENAVRETVSEANILHLAAHGILDPAAPLNSLIALAPGTPVNGTPATSNDARFYDGWLTVGEAYGLNLKHTDLVVLSACETNLGNLSTGDELVGLSRAFIFAGTPSVIASLWKVEDEATALLMERFYTHLKDGLAKAEALRQAQLEVRQEYPNPYYWSGFVLNGAGETGPQK